MTRRITTCLLSATLVVASSYTTAGSDHRAKPAKPFALVFHVATAREEAVNSWLDQLIPEANRHFEAAGISLGEVERRALPDSFNTLETIRERHKLKRFFVRRAINVFAVDEILDPVPSKATRRAAAWQGREPSGRLSGAHIPYKGRKPDTYILIKNNGSTTTVTHELGHFFGAAHSRDPTNLMSYGANRDRFSERQMNVFKRTARRFRRQKTVRELRVSVERENVPSLAADEGIGLSEKSAPNQGF